MERIRIDRTESDHNQFRNTFYNTPENIKKDTVQLSLTGYIIKAQLKNQPNLSIDPKEFPLTPIEYEIYRTIQNVKNRNRRTRIIQSILVSQDTRNRYLGESDHKKLELKVRNERQLAEEILRKRREENEERRRGIRQRTQVIQNEVNEIRRTHFELQAHNRYLRTEKGLKAQDYLRKRFWIIAEILTRRQFLKIKMGDNNYYESYNSYLNLIHSQLGNYVNQSKIPKIKTIQEYTTYEEYLSDRHDIVIFKINWIHKRQRIVSYIPFCWRCMRFNKDHLLTHPICKVKYKTFLKDKTFKQKAQTVMEWFLNYAKKITFCSNPSCNNPIHFDYILRATLGSLKKIQKYAFLIQTNIEPVFICCNCYDRKAYKKMDQLKGSNTKCRKFKRNT